MAFYQLAFCYLKRKRAKTILLYLVLLFVGSMILATNMILRATEDSKFAIQEKAKAKIVLEVLKEENKITDQEIDSIWNLEDVSAVNRIDKASAFPADFFLLTGSDSMEESNQKVMLLSYDDLQYDSAFFEGQYRLVEGNYFADGQKGAVINSMLADANGLRPGDSIHIENADGDPVELKIIGLFLSGSERKQTAQTNAVNRIENQIFVDHETYSQLFGDTGYFMASVYCKDPERLTILENQLCTILSDKVAFTSSDILYQQMVLPLDQIIRLANLMFAFTLVTGIVVISLLLCMWMRTRQKETAIFISLGKPKYSIFLQVFLESFLVFMVSVIGACGLGSVMAEYLQRMLTHSETSDVNLSVFLNAKDIGNLLIWGSLLVFTAVVISLLPVLKAKPKDTLSRMEG